MIPGANYKRRKGQSLYFWQALIGAGAGLLSAGASAQGAREQQDASERMAKETRDWQAEQNKIAMDFNERMSNTAHQREINDLKLAGLNPILSGTGGGGASAGGGVTSGGATGVAQNILGAAARDGISTAMQSMRLDAELDNMRETNKNLEADTDLKKTNQGLAYEQQRQTNEQVKMMEKQQGQIIEQTNNLQKAGRILDEDLATAKAQAMRAQDDQELLDSKGGEFVRKLGTIMRELGISGDNAVNSAVRARGRSQ